MRRSPSRDTDRVGVADHKLGPCESRRGAGAPAQRRSHREQLRPEGTAGKSQRGTPSAILSIVDMKEQGPEELAGLEALKEDKVPTVGGGDAEDDDVPLDVSLERV